MINSSVLHQKRIFILRQKKGQYSVAMIMIKKTDSSTEVKELEKGTVDYIPDVTDADKISSIIQS